MYLQGDLHLQVGVLLPSYDPVQEQRPRILGTHVKWNRCSRTPKTSYTEDCLEQAGI